MSTGVLRTQTALRDLFSQAHHSRQSRFFSRAKAVAIAKNSLPAQVPRHWRDVPS
jgi:hypothetical protein